MTEPEVAQAMLRHDEQALQRHPPPPRDATLRQPSGSGTEDLGKRRLDDRLVGNSNENHLASPTVRLADSEEAMANWSGT